MLKFSVLASGSTGNSIYVGTKTSNILIDAGLSGKKIEKSLQTIGLTTSEIDGIFVTHEHEDHIKGLGVLARKYNIPVYANKKTFDNLPKSVGLIDDNLKKFFETSKLVNLGSLKIESFAISHDAAEPVGYIIRENDFKLSIVTDLGYVSSTIKDKIKGSDAYIFETNHDIGLLRMSSYPWHIKQRILSDVGHLSNEESGETLAEIITDNTQKVFLAHLSRENNLQELARLTVKNILEDYGITEQDVKILDTYPDKPTNLEYLTPKKEIITI